MPRDPHDLSSSGGARQARRLGQLEDQKDPIMLRTGTGPAGENGKSFRGNEALSITTEVGNAPGELINRLTHATGLTATLKQLKAGAVNQVVTIQKVGTGTLTVKKLENLKISAEVILSEFDTLTLICDGTNWIEIGRSNN